MGLNGQSKTVSEKPKGPKPLTRNDIVRYDSADSYNQRLNLSLSLSLDIFCVAGSNGRRRRFR